ncbi:MAG TPA: LUD domain-containing protein [Solirubrobacteraceae bacterium]|nr:LUD domain-containing protein [Solirubrobacteraceae bacterium]
MVGDFRARLEALGGALYEVRSLRDARDTARSLVAGAGVARWADPVLDGIAELEAPPERAQVSLIVADVGVAETGAIGFAHRRGRPRAAGLLPDRQVALLLRGDLVRTQAEALARWFGEGAAAGNVVFAAGPSRTADIEQRMMLGVHGPRSLDVVLYG